MRIGNEKPVNAIAARVLAAGEAFLYRQTEGEICSDLPIPIIAVVKGIEDLTGKEFGRLRVVGLFANRKKRWACRCVCGRYCVRSATVILKASQDSACPQCYLSAISKKAEFMRRTGKELKPGCFL